MADVKGVEVRGARAPGQDQILSAAALEFLAHLERSFGPERQRLLGRAGRAPAAARCRREAQLSGRDARHPRCRLDGGVLAQGFARPARRDHRAGRPQDGDQRAQLRRLGLHGRFRGRLDADLGEFDRGTCQSDRRGAPHHRIRRSADRAALRAPAQDRDAAGAAARLAPARGACAGRWRADVGLPLRFRTLFLPQRAGIGEARHRPVFLSAEAREPARGQAVERRVRRKPEAARHCRRARSRRPC